MFTKIKSALQKAKQVLEPVRDMNEVIAEIHNEFDSSTERLLNEAKDIIGKGDASKINKAERLKKLGFNSALPVKETQEQIVNATESKRVAELIMYFQQWYPNNKFITEKEVEKICKKYGLICGETTYYIGDMPDKNLAEIEGFNLRDADKERRTNIDDWHSMRMVNLMRQSSLNMLQNIGQSSSFGSLISPRPVYNNTYDTMPTMVTERFVQPSFKICAPVKDFDTRYMRIEDGYKLSQIPDPIVLQPVKGGYLIVSKWGLEASDEIVVNEKMN